MIELAPHHKYGLAIVSPLMPASGSFGFGFPYQDLVDPASLGALVTNPVSLSPRRAARGRRFAVRGQVFVIHTGWPNPGLRRVIRTYGPLWERLGLPVIVHLLAGHPGEVGRAVALLSTVPGVGGVELGFPTHVQRAQAVAAVEAAVTQGELPVLVQVPFGRVDDLAEALILAGADALTLTAPPRGVLPLEGLPSPTGDVIHYLRGRLYGRALLPLLLYTLAHWASRLEVPVIACGGIASGEDALACLSLGASAVQLDALVWREPGLFETVARALAFDEAAGEEEAS